MLRVGLTGGIGAGKSVAAQFLAARGAVVIDADQLARAVVAPGTEGLTEIVSAFGPGVLRDGALDRESLAERVFSDSEARRRLETIIHPKVRARAKELMLAAQDSIVVNDVPLLVESGLAADFHLVAVVEARNDVRLDRLLLRGMRRAEVEARMAAQASDAARRVAADVLMDNSGDLSTLRAQVDSLWERLVIFDENLALRRPVGFPDTLAIAAPDPTWAEQYQRLAARIRRAAGDIPVTVHHIGSTAVPDLPAKDLIDVQLGVEDLSVADAMADSLAAGGFPACTGEWWDSPKPPDSGPWLKRLHGAADPARPVNLHIRVVGSPAWRWALLFRDWLRAVPRETAAYAAEKSRLAALGLTTSEYAEAKEPWFHAADERAEEWAKASRWTPPSP